jgi:Ca2+-binding RTX toxin-like protein
LATYVFKDQTDNIGPDIDGGAYEAVTVTSSHFGTNTLLNDAIMRDDTSEALSDIEYLNAGPLRYPGGTVTEELFDITNSEATIGEEDDGGHTNIVPLSEFLDFAAEVGSSVNIVLPTRDGLNLSAAEALKLGTYGERVPTETYLEEISAFIIEVISKASARGVVVESFEIGNEFWLGGRMTAEEYGRLAGEIALVVQNILFDLGYSRSERPDILLQSSSNAGKFSPRETTKQSFHEGGEEYTFAIPGQGKASQQLDAIKTALGNVVGAVDAIDGIVDHYYDKKGFDGVDTSGQFIFEQFDELANWIQGQRSPWLLPIKRYVTEWNVKRDGGSEPQGLQGAAIDIEMFYEMVTHGVDAAQFWPLTGAGNNLASMNEGVSINGETFRLMSSSLLGLRPELDFENTLLDVHGFGNDIRDVLLVSERSSTDQTDITLDFNETYNGGEFFIVVTKLSDGLANGMDPNVAPVLTYTDGYVSTDSKVTFDLEAWSIARVEVFYITNGDDLIEGRDGNDWMMGGEGNDTLDGGNGKDTVSAGHGRDVVFGGGGNDVINGQQWHDTLHGGDGHDTLQGHEGRDEIFGGDGDDLIDGGQWHDTLEGGAGDDTLEGGLGNDALVGNEGNNSLLGQGGDDFIFVDSGFDTVDGGLGNDTLSFEESSQSVTIWSGRGNVELGSEIIHFDDIEVFFGSAFSDQLSIISDNNVIHGLEGGDSLQVLDGRNNFVDLGEGQDIAFIFFGEDNVVHGGDENDEFWSFGGDDNVFDGGQGNDVFLLSGGEDHVLNYAHGDGADTVSGFDVFFDRIHVQGRSLEHSMIVDSNDDGTIISFGNGDSITLDGVFDASIDQFIEFL